MLLGAASTSPKEHGTAAFDQYGPLLTTTTTIPVPTPLPPLWSPQRRDASSAPARLRDALQRGAQAALRPGHAIRASGWVGLVVGVGLLARVGSE